MTRDKGATIAEVTILRLQRTGVALGSSKKKAPWSYLTFFIADLHAIQCEALSGTDVKAGIIAALEQY